MMWFNKQKLKWIIVFLSIFLILLFVLFYITYNIESKSSVNKIYQNNSNAIPSDNDVDLWKRYDNTGSSLKTIYGMLTAKPSETKSNYIDIYLDNKVILTSFDTVIEYQIMLESHLILIVITDIGGSMGNTSRSLIDIAPNKSFIVQDIPNSWAGTLFFKSNSCIYSKTRDKRVYADDTDYNLYEYCINTSGMSYAEYAFAKPDVYYEQKFSTLTSKEIYEQAVADSCAANYQLDDSNRCNGGYPYCFMFNAKLEKENDVYTRILKNFCTSNNDSSDDKNNYDISKDSNSTSGFSILDISDYMHGGFVGVAVKEANEYTGNYMIYKILVNPEYHIYCVGAIEYYHKDNKRYGLPEMQNCMPGDTNQWADVKQDTFLYELEQYVIHSNYYQNQKNMENQQQQLHKDGYTMNKPNSNSSFYYIDNKGKLYTITIEDCKTHKYSNKHVVTSCQKLLEINN